MGRVNSARIHTLQEGGPVQGPVIYWMSRDQRMEDNWALIHAQDEALRRNAPLEIVFCLASAFLGAALRHYHFMFQGLMQVEKKAREFNISFSVLCGEPAESLAEYVRQRGCSCVVTDFDPLRIKRGWVRDFCEEFRGTLLEVDAHNIVPCRIASDKQEYAARTIRPKIHKKLREFMEDFPEVEPHPFGRAGLYESNNWQELQSYINPDSHIPIADWIVPGSRAGLEMLDSFLSKGIRDYDKGRNDPNADAQSDLSPYLHFGQISPQRVALEAVKVRDAGGNNIEAFIEELVVRRELTDNFCFYNPDYDSLKGIADWAYRTLDDHRNDARPYVYDQDSFEKAQTHSDLWNAAQTQMLKTGKMHGYMRMFWAKKILEWSNSPEEAVRIAIHLNDSYSLDGRDPNGYVGVLWSIGGVHDRGWTEREVYGKIRYMNERGCRRKFNVDKYIFTWLGMRPAK